MVAMLLFPVYLDFNLSQTTDKSSQQPGTFSIQSFWIDELIKLFLKICFSRGLDRILKNSFLSTFKRDIGLNYLMLFGSGLPDLGI